MMPVVNDCVDVIERKRADCGMTIRALSKKSGICENVLYNILGKKRKMLASELLSLSAVLMIDFDDFYKKAV